MSNFRIRDSIHVIDSGYHYPIYHVAFEAMNFNDTDHNWQNEALSKNTIFKVIGLFPHHLFPPTIVVGVQYKDIQLAIEDKGCILIKHFELNNKIKIL